MKKRMTSDTLLSPWQNQAMRMNKLEYRRLQRDIDIMHNNLCNNLSRLQRQAQDLKYRYSKFVRYVKPNPAYALWKATHGLNLEEESHIFHLEPIKSKQKPKTKKQQQQEASTSDVVTEPSLPLLVSVSNSKLETVQPLIDISKSLVRPNTSPVKKPLRDKSNAKPVLAIDNCQQSLNSSGTQPYENSSVSCVSSFVSISTRTTATSTTTTTTTTQNKSLNRPKKWNTDSSNQNKVQNRVIQKPGERKHIERLQFNGKKPTSNHPTVERTIRSGDSIK